MAIGRKKRKTAILIFDVIAGLLLFCTYADRQYHKEKKSCGTGGGSLVQESAQEVKKIALTFDDGPHFQFTEQILDGLRERGVKATFFVTGEHAALHPEIVERMKEEGHLVGNHTYSHMQLTDSNREAFRQELIATNQVLEEILGEEIAYVRPPYGSWDRKFEKELNMIPVLWTVDPQDWKCEDAAVIAARVVANAEENDIILMHDYFKSSVTAALRIADELTAGGYEFVTVEEILFD